MIMIIHLKLNFITEYVKINIDYSYDIYTVVDLISIDYFAFCIHIRWIDLSESLDLPQHLLSHQR